jgi:hypothetical protein
MDLITERHRVTNTHPGVVDFRIEPWGEVYPMGPGVSYEVVAQGPPETGSIQVEYGDDEIVVYGWPGSTLHVFDEAGQPVGGTGRGMVPDLPPGVSTPDFVKWMRKFTGD